MFRYNILKEKFFISLSKKISVTKQQLNTNSTNTNVNSSQKQDYIYFLHNDSGVYYIYYIVYLDVIYVEIIILHVTLHP